MEEIRSRYNLSLIVLHGSRVTGKLHGKSDIDIAVVRKEVNQDLNLLGLISDLAQELKDDRIDVTDITNANPLLLFAVMKKSKLLAGNEKDYERLKLVAFHKYSDYLPFLKREADFVKERIMSYAQS